MLILFYNKLVRTRFAFYDQLDADNLDVILPKDVEITFDRGLLPQADAVVFNVPFLSRDLECDIDKPDGQIWVGWSYESEANYPWMFSDEIKELFDLWMTYHLDSDIVCPYYDRTFFEKLAAPVSEKTHDICMHISSPVNHSGRQEYLSELMAYIQIDSYGRWRRNRQMEGGDVGYQSKLELIKKYKFTIAFENAVSGDYVTEKFFDPLVSGSVPIYLGAPNIARFSPGENAFIDVRDYSSPKSLAAELKKYCREEKRYATLHEWRNHPLRPEFRTLVDEQMVHPFVRMADKIRLLKAQPDLNRNDQETVVLTRKCSPVVS